MGGMLMGKYEFPLLTALEATNPFLGNKFYLIVTGTTTADFALTVAFRLALAVNAITIVLVFVVGAALALGLLAVIVLSTLTLLAFGSFSPAQALALELAAEPVPFGSHQFIHLPWEERATRPKVRSFSLRHSAPYQDAAAIELVVDWASKHLADPSSANGPTQN